MAEEKAGLLARLLGSIRNRFPHARLIAYGLVTVQLMWRLWNGVGSVLDAYSHAEFFAQHGKQMVAAVATAAHAVFSPTGSLVSVLMAVGYLIIDGRTSRSSIVAMSDTATLPARPAVGEGPVVPVARSREIRKPIIIEKQTWHPLTAGEVVQFIEFLGPRSGLNYSIEPIKFLATDDGRAIAEPIARLVVALGYEVIVNHDNASYIFPVQVSSGVNMRYPVGSAAGIAFRLGTALRRANLNPSQSEFPKSDQYNFVQVEIGNYTNYAQIRLG